MRARADAGNKDSAGHLANLLADRGDLDRLRALADAGDAAASGTWPTCWPNRGDLDEADEAVELLRAGADAGDKNSARKLADLLATRGDLKGEARSCVAWLMLATGVPLYDCPITGQAGDLDGCAPGPMRRWVCRCQGWSTCWPTAVTWTSCAHGPMQVIYCRPAAGRPPAKLAD